MIKAMKKEARGKNVKIQKIANGVGWGKHDIYNMKTVHHNQTLTNHKQPTTIGENNAVKATEATNRG